MRRGTQEGRGREVPLHIIEIFFELKPITRGTPPQLTNLLTRQLINLHILCTYRRKG